MKRMPRIPLVSLVIAFYGLQVAAADELTQMVEDSLSQLGYDTGVVDGEADVKTAIAVSQYQAEKGLDVTGEISPQLAGMLAADVKNGGVVPASAPASAPAAAPVPVAQPAPDPAALAAAQQACLQQKMAEQQAKQQKKKAFGKMLSAIGNTAFKYGDYDTAQTVSEVYSAEASASDIAQAAKDMGLTEQDVADCENPYSNSGA
jgi:peptidoglycan hydrolase-like protein with peptidoglycan-binding domain